MKSFEPCPEPDVRRIGHLGLHPHQMLNLLGGGASPALEQVLPREQGAVEGSLAENFWGQWV
jgi:hypothetical protein